MRKGVLPALCVVILSLSSCVFQEKKEAQVFYDRIRGINDTFAQLTYQWHSLLDTALTRKNYTNLNANRIKLGAYISQARSDVANMKLTKSNELIKTEEENLLLTQSLKVAEVYPQFEQYSPYTPKDDLAGSLKQLGDDLDTVQTSLQKIDNLMELYVAKYSLKKPKTLPNNRSNAVKKVNGSVSKAPQISYPNTKR